MELTLTCPTCGTTGKWSADTFSEVRAAVEEAGWAPFAALCPDHRIENGATDD